MAKPELNTYRGRMDKAVTALKEEFSSLRTGRASAGLLDPIMVEAYGSTTPLTSVAAISVPEPRMISVSVWDKAVVVSVEKAIRSSGLGLNPVVDGLKKAEKAGDISQDEQKKMEAEVQKDTDAAIKRIDEALKAKEVEIMQV